MQQNSNRCGFHTDDRIGFKSNTEGKLWQTIENKIRVAKAVSRVVNKLRAVKAIKVAGKPGAVKVSRADSRVAKAVNKVAVKRAANRAASRIANFISVTRGEAGLEFHNSPRACRTIHP